MALFEKKQQLLSGPKKAPTPPSKPKTIFEEKKEWSKVELERRMRKASPYIPGTGGKFYIRQERKEMLGKGLEKLFPYERFKSHISESEAKRVLRGLRRQEYRARTGAEKLKLNRERRWLEETWGLKGKY
jgi:hypothetical protein